MWHRGPRQFLFGLLTRLSTENGEERTMITRSRRFAFWLCIPALLLGSPSKRIHTPNATTMNHLRRGCESRDSSDRNYAFSRTISGVQGAGELGPVAAPGAVGCSDPIDNCKKPIKYLGSKGTCACFACEYGEAKQHNICTQNKKDKESLLVESEHQ